MKRVARLLGRSSKRDGVVMPAVAALLTLAVAGAVAVQGRPAPTRKAQQPAAAVVDKKAEQKVGSAPLVKAPVEAPKTLLAQNAAPNDTTRKPLSPEELREKEKELKKELLTPYKNWMNNEVVYIISDEEKKAFQRLNTDEERERFVEQFWERRDPTPGTTENEFKAEIYRRIGYANEHFAGSVAGWRTDRGRIYIQYGPPDEIETHPASQAGGAMQTYPFEQWRYRFIDGVGQNIIIEFVDKNGTGDYQMTMDPNTKDALLKAR